MSKKIIIIIIVTGILVSMLIFCTKPALAISNGEIDGSEHPNVGALFANLKGTTTIFPVCSGVLIDPEIFLTAGHCFPPAELAQFYDFFVTFDSKFDPSDPFSGNLIGVNAFYVDPEFGHDMGDLHDIAVAILSENSTQGIEPANLPTANQLDEMSKKCGLCDNDFINVGYGMVPEWKKGPTRFLPIDGFRRMSISPFMGLTKNWLLLLMNNDATGEGGVCYGDSGGAHFLAETPDLLVALTTGGDYVCRALNYNYRLDTPSARSFLSQFIELP